MIPPDQEIYKVEERIARRRHNAEFLAKESARRTLVALTSPGALVAAAVVGFLAGGGIGKKKPHYVDRRRSDDTTTKKAAKATGLAGVLMSGAMFVVNHKFGGPFGLAQFILQKVQGHRTAHQRVERPFA